MEVIKSTEQFEEIISSSEPAIVKFVTGWCPDCRRMDMFIGDIIDQHSEYKWFEINRDEFPEIGQKYDVMGIPSLLIFKDGEKTAHLHSAKAKTPEQVNEFLDSVK